MTCPVWRYGGIDVILVDTIPYLSFLNGKSNFILDEPVNVPFMTAKTYILSLPNHHEPVEKILTSEPK